MKKEAPLNFLDTYLPPGTFKYVEKYLTEFKVHLTVTRERTSVYGNYQWSYRNHIHRVSVNGNLNPFSFLVTLLHEFAHMLTFQKHGARVPPHGAQWKHEYGEILKVFLAHKIFPKDIEDELTSVLKNPAASSCAETSLLRVLRKYDLPKPGFFLIEDIPEKSFFRLKNGTVYEKMHKVRKRIICKDIATKRLYYFSPVAEVELLHHDPVHKR